MPTHSEWQKPSLAHSQLILPLHISQIQLNRSGSMQFFCAFDKNVWDYNFPMVTQITFIKGELTFFNYHSVLELIHVKNYSPHSNSRGPDPDCGTSGGAECKILKQPWKSTQLLKTEFQRRFHLGPGQGPARVSYVFVFSMSIYWWIFHIYLYFQCQYCVYL